MPRQGKLPPELALRLDASDASTQNILHLLNLLQSPAATDHPETAHPSKEVQTQLSATQSRPLDDLQDRGSHQLSRVPASSEGMLTSPDGFHLSDDTAAPDGTTEAANPVGEADSAGVQLVSATKAAAVPDTPMAQAAADSSGLSAHESDAQAASQGQTFRDMILLQCSCKCCAALDNLHTLNTFILCKSTFAFVRA